MIRLTNFVGLLLLLYLWYNHEPWFLSINAASVISAAFVSTLKTLNPYLINMLFCLCCILYLVHLYWRILPYLMYTITLILLHVLTKISVSFLMLQDTTTFLAFTVNHPIPYELRLYHLEYSLLFLIETYCPEIFYNKALISKLQVFLNANLDLTAIKEKNAKEIFTYAVQLLNEFSFKTNLAWPKTTTFVLMTSLIVTFIFATEFFN